MKKSIRLLTVIIAISLVFTSAFTASAAKADIEKVGGIPTRFVTDFENLGGATVDSSDALFGSDASKGVDFGVKSGYGVNGSNAYVLGNNSADNYFAEASYNPNFDDAAKTEGLENATDMVFYINGEGETDELAFMIVFGEWDYDSDGNPVMKKNNETGNMENAVTFWKVADDINTTYYSLADGETEWKKHTGTSNAYVRLPAGFKGYVRVPLDNFDPDWNSKDENDKMDLVHLTRVSFFYGIYNRHKTTGYAMAIDNIGFAGEDLSKVVEKPADSNNENNAGENKVTDTGSAENKNEANPSADGPATGDAPIAVLGVVVLASAAVIAVSRKKIKK